MTPELGQVHAEPWCWLPPGMGTLALGHCFRKRGVFCLVLASSQQFLCVPTREQPQHRVVVSGEMKTGVVGLGVRPNQSYLTPSSLITLPQT